MTDLTVSLSALGSSTGVVGATASYANGVLVGVSGTAVFGTGGWAVLNDATALVWNGSGGWEDAPTVSLVYDAADTMATFTLPDYTDGAISFTIPWNQVDPDQASQSLTPTAFNLNIAGHNLASGSASYTTAPTLLFANGNLVGVNFALDTSAIPNFAYTSLSMSGWNVTAVPIGGGLPMFVAAAPVMEPVLVIDFSTYNSTSTAHTLRVRWKPSDGTDEAVLIPIPAGTDPGVVRTLVASVLEDNGLKVTEPGETKLRVKGTAAGKLTELRLDTMNNPPMG